MISGITAGSLTDRQISRQIGIAGSLEPHGTIQSHRIHGAAIICYIIYGNIYHQYTPNVSIYIPYMDPMGVMLPQSNHHAPASNKVTLEIIP